MIKYVALYDLHFGYELKYKDGKRYKSPTHNLAAVRAAMSFVADFQPKYFILGGDQVEFGAISRHNNGKPRLVEGLRVVDDMDLLDKHVLTPLEVISSINNKIWIPGNHETRANRYLDENPGTEGLIEPENYLKLKQRGWEVQEEEIPYRLGKLHFVHGHSIFASGAGQNPARKLAFYYRRSIIAGHIHTGEMAMDITPADRSDFHAAYISPAMCNVSPDYMKNRPSNAAQGFVYGYVRPDGNFNNYTVIIVDGKFSVNEKTYNGNK